jgi:hypothetical protein
MKIIKYFRRLLWPTKILNCVDENTGILNGFMKSSPPQNDAELSPMEKWLFEEAAEQVVDLMDLSDGCCSVPMMF